MGRVSLVSEHRSIGVLVIHQEYRGNCELSGTLARRTMIFVDTQMTRDGIPLRALPAATSFLIALYYRGQSSSYLPTADGRDNERQCWFDYLDRGLPETTIKIYNVDTRLPHSLKGLASLLSPYFIPRCVLSDEAIYDIISHVNDIVHAIERESLHWDFSSGPRPMPTFPDTVRMSFGLGLEQIRIQPALLLQQGTITYHALEAIPRDRGAQIYPTETVDGQLPSNVNLDLIDRRN